MEVEALPHSAGTHWNHSISWTSREILRICSNFEVPAFCVAWIPITRPLEGLFLLAGTGNVPPTDWVPLFCPEFPLALLTSLGSHSRGGSCGERCCALVQGALLLFNPCCAVPKLASLGCCRDSDTARAQCCFSEGHRSGDTSCTTARGTTLSPALHPWDQCFSLLGFSWLFYKAWVFFLKMVMPD